LLHTHSVLRFADYRLVELNEESKLAVVRERFIDGTRGIRIESVLDEQCDASSVVSHRILMVIRTFFKK
jgi:hypothetical protein